MKKNIALRLSYLGTNYHGWQRQDNAVTVQGILEDSLKKLTKEDVSLLGCGRTDTGVHASVYVANFRTETTIPVDRIPYALSSSLPGDISVLEAQETDPGFHSRFSCLKKQYVYMMYVSPFDHPFLYDRAYRLGSMPDISAMRDASKAFEGEHDFAAMRSLGTDVSSTIRTLYECAVEEKDGLISIRMTANGFLYNMARTIAGTLLEVGSRRIEKGRIPSIIANKDRSAAGPTAPAHGLYLTGLWYEKEAIVCDNVFTGALG